MSINFCTSELVSISSNATNFENHEVMNLVSHARCKPGRGFMADSFVKPPVNVSVKFVCKVDVSHVLLKTCVGSQRSVSFEISTEGSKGNGKVGLITDAIDVDYIIFHKFGVERFSESWKQLQRCMKVPFQCPYRLTNVTKINIRVNKTSNSTVPCLGHLEIWGDPSKSVPKEIVVGIVQKWKTYLKTELNKPVLSDLIKNVTHNESNQGYNYFNDIPEEFIDPITCDIMLCPMILPCGKVIDQSTLNKYFKVEEEWGRGPSDPFTGVPFSSDRKPCVNTILKSKIDKFLVKNSDLDSIKKMPRIIGTKPLASVPGYKNVITMRKPSTSVDRKELCEASSSSLASPTCKVLQNTKRSLDEFISDSLIGLPSYLEIKKTKLEPKEECPLCQKSILLFRLPCTHLICRVCLLNLDASSKCSVCQQIFNRHEPVRYHNN